MFTFYSVPARYNFAKELPSVQRLMTKLVEWAKKIREEEEELTWFFYEEDLSGLEDFINTDKEGYEDYISVVCGASRFCFMHSSWNFVIKIPYYEYDSSNACEREINNYEIAKEYSVTDMLLPIHRFAVWEDDFNIDFYIQNKVNCRLSNLDNKTIVEMKEQTTATERDFLQSAFYQSYRMASELIITLLVKWGAEMAFQLADWTQEVEIEDLRAPNIGYINDKPVLIDYAGFNN